MTSAWCIVIVTVALATATMTVTALVARRVGRVSVVDVAWGLGLAAIAVGDAVIGGRWENWVLAAVVTAWGIRLSTHIGRRARGHGEDPRYVDFMGGTLADVGMGVAVRKVFVVQGLAVCLVSLPLAAAAYWETESTAVFVIGIVLAVAGMLCEAIGDAQLSGYKADPDRGPVLDTGLWAWTRHPNYFGDALMWTGLWVAGGLASGWVAALVSLPSPAAMAWFLVVVTGAKLLEQKMMERPAYREYAERTSMFVPLPPKRR